MLLPHFFGWSPEQLRNFCALQTTLLPVYFTLFYPRLRFSPHMEERISAWEEWQRRRNEKQHLKVWKENIKSKENYDKTHTQTHFFLTQPKWMVRRDARVSSFIMHACVCVCSASFTLIRIPFARFLLHALCLNGFSNRLFYSRYERVCVWVGFPFLLHASFFKCLIIFYSNLRCIFKAIRNETAKQRREQKNKKSISEKTQTPSSDTSPAWEKSTSDGITENKTARRKKCAQQKWAKCKQRFHSFILILACVILKQFLMDFSNIQLNYRMSRITL